MYLYICIDVWYICAYMYKSYICVYIYIVHIYTYTYVCIYVYIHIWIYPYVYIYIHIRTCVYISLDPANTCTTHRLAGHSYHFHREILPPDKSLSSVSPSRCCAAAICCGIVVVRLLFCSYSTQQHWHCLASFGIILSLNY